MNTLQKFHNNVEVTFAQTQMQTIYQPKVNKDDKLEVKRIKEVKEHNIAASFTAGTDQAINAKNMANWFIQCLLNWQKLRPLQGMRGFQTSKLVTVSFKVAGKTIETGIKFTTNLDRLESSLERTQAIVASLFTKQYTLHQLNDNNVVLNAAQIKPQDVVICKSKKMEVATDGALLVAENVPA